MERYFNFEMPALRFLWHTLVASLAGLVPLLGLYVLLTSGFASHLAAGGPVLVQFLRQVLTNGLPVVFVVNYAAFTLFAWHVAQRRQGLTANAWHAIPLDLALRVGLFVGLHAFIYVVSADWFGSFGGNRLTALSVVGPTLVRSAYFENISGAYFYATIVSALPLYVAVLRSRTTISMPAAVFCGLLIFAAGAATLIIVSAAIVRYQNG